MVGGGRIVREAVRRRGSRTLAMRTHKDAGTLCDESVSRREPKAATAACDDVDPVAQVEIHRASAARAYGGAQ